MVELMKSDHSSKAVVAAAITWLVLIVACPTLAPSAEVLAQNELSEDLAPLAFMLGTWRVAEIHDAGPMGKGGRGLGEMVARAGPGGTSLVIDYRSLEGPVIGFSMLEIFTFEREKNRFQQAYVTSWSKGLVVVVGERLDSGFVFERKIDRNGRVFHSRGTIQEISKASFVMESHMAPAGGDSTRTMRLEFSRP